MKREKLNTIVLELECLESEQWLQQIRSFQAGQPGGCSWKRIIGSKYVHVCKDRSIYISCQSFSIVYDGIYFVSKVYTIINRHIPPYTVIYDILVYTSICKDIISYFDIYEYMQ